MKYYIYVCTFAIFLLSGLNFTSNEEGGFLSRVIAADILGAFIVLTTVVLLSIKGRLYVPKTYRIYSIFLITLFISCVFSMFKTKAIVEYIIHLYIFLLSLSLYNLFILYEDKVDIQYIITSALWGGAIIAMVGLLHFFIFPSWFPVVSGGLSGTFRNTGQAGAYFGVLLAIFIPAFFSNTIKKSILNIFLILLIVLALIFTLKRSSIIGFFIGLLLMVAMNSLRSKNDFKNSILFVCAIYIIGLIAFIFFNWGLSNIPGMRERFEYKFSSDASEGITNFFSENVEAAFSAFYDRPILGVGLNNIIGVYTEEYEIHNGYLSILSSSGFLGALIFFLFLIYSLRLVIIRSKYNDFIKYLLPFYIGLIVSWVYTYPLRKREVWLFFFIISAMLYISKKKCSRKNEVI